MKSSNIGGQAVLEGIMMKHKEDYAVAVRKPDGEIFVQKDTYRGDYGSRKTADTDPVCAGASLILLILWCWALGH